MKGHIRERSPGHWAIILDVRDPRTGERKRRWHGFVGTKRQAQIECARLVLETQKGTLVDPTRETVAAFLERWIEYMQGQVSPRSLERYAELCRKNLAPLLGGLALAKLQPAHTLPGLRQSARQRPPGWQRWPFCAHRDAHAPSAARSAAARPLRGSCSPAILSTRSSRPRWSASSSALRHPADCGIAGRPPRQPHVHPDCAGRPLRPAAGRGRGPSMETRRHRTPADGQAFATSRQSLAEPVQWRCRTR